MKSKIANLQYAPSAVDLMLVLAMVRGGSLAAAAERQQQDASTVFRALQRLERSLGRRLFERSRQGYQPSELALQLAALGEQMEATLEAARNAMAVAPGQVEGSVRITTTDTVLHSLVGPALRQLCREHPLLNLELQTGNELANLSRRDADIALRATRKPPQHLVGKRLGSLRVALYAARESRSVSLEDALAGRLDWVAPDDALPEHPSVLWRKRLLPRLLPRYRVSSILSVAELVALGLGVGVLPLFLAEARRDLRRLSEPLPECETDLWLLAHPEARHLRRLNAVYAHLGQAIVLP